MKEVYDLSKYTKLSQDETTAKNVKVKHAVKCESHLSQGKTSCYGEARKQFMTVGFYCYQG